MRRDTPLRALVLLVAMLNFCTSGPIGVGLPYLTKTKFGTPAAYAFLISSAAAGGLVGTLLAGIVKVRRRGLLILSACAFLSVCLASIGSLPHLWLIASVLFVMTMAAGIANVNIIAWLQKRIDPALRGRIMSVVMVCGLGLLPVSLAVAGFMITWNLQRTFLLAGAAMLLITFSGVVQKQVREIE